MFAKIRLARLHQRVSMILPLVVILSLLLAACAVPGAPVAPAADSGGSEESAATGSRALPDDAAEDQTIHYVTRGFSRLDPASEGGFGRFVISHMWMPFFIRDDAGTISPWLATGYEVNEDQSVYTCLLYTSPSPRD